MTNNIFVRPIYYPSDSFGTLEEVGTMVSVGLGLDYDGMTFYKTDLGKQVSALRTKHIHIRGLAFGEPQPQEKTDESPA